MPQNGLHGLVGLGTARLLTNRAPESASVPFAASITLGAMLPDVDMYPTAIAFLLGRTDLIYSIHRTATHSLLAAAISGLVGLALRHRSPQTAWAAFGLAIGISTHIILDLFFWFAQLDLFWPLSHLPPRSGIRFWPTATNLGGKAWFPIIDFWGVDRPDRHTEFQLPPAFGNPKFLVAAREALEIPFFAWFLCVLRRLSQPKVNAAMNKIALFLWVLSVASMAAVFLVSYTFLEIGVMTAYLLFVLPYCWSGTWKLRAEIANWAQRGTTRKAR